jgi:type III secretion protein L
MTAFCIDTITSDAGLRAEHGVLRANALTVTTDARALAARIVEEARAEAEALKQEASAAARQLTQDAETQTLQRAEQLLQALGQAHETFLQHAQSMVVDLAQGLFDRLVLEATPREKIEAVFRRVQQEAPSRMVNPLLRVHPDDFSLIPSTEWEVKADASMQRGVCRLEASGGEWRADFDASVAALKSAFAAAVMEPEASQGDA